MTRTRKAIVRALRRLGRPEPWAEEMAQRYTALLPTLARAVAPGEPDAITYAMAWGAEDDADDARRSLGRLRVACRATAKTVERMCREALKADDYETMRRTLAALQASAELQLRTTQREETRHADG